MYVHCKNEVCMLNGVINDIMGLGSSNHTTIRVINTPTVSFITSFIVVATYVHFIFYSVATEKCSPRYSWNGMAYHVTFLILE